MSARTPAWNPPPEQRTAPDQLPGEAWRAIDLFDGEAVRRCWRTAHGFLILTNLRCVLVWRHRELFHARAWESGPEVFLYNVADPRVVLGRFVEIAPAVDEGDGLIRAGVADPRAVAGEIRDEIPAARQEWDRRRTKMQQDLAAHQARRAQIAAVIAAGGSAPVPKVPCPYCGSSIPVTARRCPNCGAPMT